MYPAVAAKISILRPLENMPKTAEKIEVKIAIAASRRPMFCTEYRMTMARTGNVDAHIVPMISPTFVRLESE